MAIFFRRSLIISPVCKDAAFRDQNCFVLGSTPSISTHGYGVSIGSILAARLAARLAAKGDDRFIEINDAWIERQIDLTRKLGLPISLNDIGRSYSDSPETSPKNLLTLATSDKKSEFGLLNFILPVRLGKCIYVKNVDPEDVLAVLN